MLVRFMVNKFSTNSNGKRVIIINGSGGGQPHTDELRSNTWKQIRMKIDSLITAPFSVDPFAIKWAAKNYE